MSTSNRQRAQAHAKRGYYCRCGRIVHGNGARAMHFYVGGDRYTGKREGHGEISHERWLIDTEAGRAWTAEYERQRVEIQANTDRLNAPISEVTEIS